MAVEPIEAGSIHKVAVIGAGQMGRGIAQVAAAAGLEVVLTDASVELAQKAKDVIFGILKKQVEKGKTTDDAVAALVDRIRPAAAGQGLDTADIAIEAVTESFDVKASIFRATDEALREGAILASNTSSISITKLAALTRRPTLVVGMHFMNPVPLMKLVELVRGVQTSPETFAATFALAEKLGKTVIVSNDAPGFMVNRILIPFIVEACFALQEGVGSADDIDTGAKLGLNHPMGPLELADLIGLDTVLSISEVLYREIGDDKYRAPTNLKNLVAAGYLGRKTKRGFYGYDDRGARIPV
jgi:3-hydroxybutyryl-CoA dehydrogenase